MLKELSDRIIQGVPKGETVECQFTTLANEATAQVNHVKVSHHPLGLYSTWVTLENLKILVNAQTDNSTWIRTFPSKDQVAKFSREAQ